MIHNINIHAVGMEEIVCFCSVVYSKTLFTSTSILQIYDVGSGGK